MVLLRQVFGQHDGEKGPQVHWREGLAVSNEERIVSPSDPEARSSRKRPEHHNVSLKHTSFADILLI